jgi:hypothetical protein
MLVNLKRRLRFFFVTSIQNQTDLVFFKVDLLNNRCEWVSLFAFFFDHAIDLLPADAATQHD